MLETAKFQPNSSESLTAIDRRENETIFVSFPATKEKQPENRFSNNRFFATTNLTLHYTAESIIIFIFFTLNQKVWL